MNTQGKPMVSITGQDINSILEAFHGASELLEKDSGAETWVATVYDVMWVELERRGLHHCYHGRWSPDDPCDTFCSEVDA